MLKFYECFGCFFIKSGLFALLVVGVASGGLLTPKDSLASEIKEWKVPYENSRPRDPYTADGETVWFVGQRTHYLAALDVKSGAFRKVPLAQGTGPHNLIVEADGTVWFAANRQRYIGRYRAGEAIHKIVMPDPAARDPHTLIFDGHGKIWFTLQGSNMVGRLDMKTEKVDLIPVPTPGARPYGIIIDPNGRVWIALFGTNRLAVVDPESLELLEIVLPREASRPRRLEATLDGMIWYGDYRGGKLGRLDPESGEITEWDLPGGEASRPYAMALDHMDRVWLVETGPSPNRFVGFDPRSKTFFETVEVPSGGGTVRHMMLHRQSRTIWFGTDANTVGRLKLD